MIFTNIPSLIAPATADPTAIARTLATHLGQPGLAVRAAATGSGLTRTIAAQIVNRLGRPCEGVYYVLVCISTAIGTGPGGSQSLSPPSAGSLVEEITNDQVLVYMTDPRGLVEFDIVQSGTWSTRVIHASVIGVVQAISV